MYAAADAAGEPERTSSAVDTPSNRAATPPHPSSAQIQAERDAEMEAKRKTPVIPTLMGSAPSKSSGSSTAIPSFADAPTSKNTASSNELQQVVAMTMTVEKP